MHAVYVSGEHVDVAALTTKYRLKPFHNLHIAITGFPVDDGDGPRTALTKRIAENGAVYRATFDTDCSHLIIGPELSAVARDQPDSLFNNAKFAKAAEFNRFKHQHHVHIVWSEWLEDSFTLKGAVDETNYDCINCPRPSPDRIVKAKKPDPSPASSGDSKTPSQLLREDSRIVPLDLFDNAQLGGGPSNVIAQASSADSVNLRKHKPDERDQQEVVSVKRRKLDRSSAMSVNKLLFDDAGATDALPELPEIPTGDNEVPSEHSAWITAMAQAANAASLFEPPPALAASLSTSRSATFVNAPRPFQNSFATNSAQPTTRSATVPPASKSLSKGKSKAVASRVQQLEVDMSMDATEDNRADDSGVQFLSSPKRTKEPEAPDQIFAGVRITLTGFDDTMKRRASKLLSERGAILLPYEDEATADWICCPLLECVNSVLAFRLI